MMGEVIDMASHQKCPDSSDVGLFIKRAVVSYEIMHEKIPFHTRLARWALRQPRLGDDLEERIQTRLEEVAVNCEEAEEAIILSFKGTEE